MMSMLLPFAMCFSGSRCPALTNSFLIFELTHLCCVLGPVSSSWSCTMAPTLQRQRYNRSVMKEAVGGKKEDLKYSLIG